MLKIHTNESNFNLVVPTPQQISATIERLRCVPTLTENESGLLNVARCVLDRATRAGDTDAQVAAMRIAERVSHLSRLVDTDGTAQFADQIWSVEKRPAKSLWEEPQVGGRI